MNVDSQRAGELFDAAQNLGAPERAAFLDAECRDQPALRQRVAEMLTAAGAEEEHTEVQSADLRAFASRMEGVGDRVGRYKLLQKIGEGGCGVVYMAEQEEPIRRRVALKVIKRGMDTRQVIARFEAERQALAMMDHPNIAKVLDAGETDLGRPFFVMELVSGIPITQYCDQQKLNPQERLKLFLPVCHAIQHAHEKGIIHRDVKPSNVLVAFQNGAVTPKVIDFGIAKATEGRLTDKTLFTAFEQFMGTPAYMSPEQAEMSPLGIDFRSDIYSLGVLLYELLTGNTPFETRQLLEAGVDEIRRIIREDDPPTPSARLTRLEPPEMDSIARKRCSEPPALAMLLAGDLDCIVMASLEKDRTRRYQTATDLSQDIGRYLRNEPILARPTTVWRRAVKWGRRHPAPVTIIGITVGAAIACISLAFYAWKQNRRAALLEAAAMPAVVTNTRAQDPLLAATQSGAIITPRSATATNTGIMNLRISELNATRTEARVRFDYSYDGVGGPVVQIIPSMGIRGTKGVAAWFGGDAAEVGVGSGSASMTVKFFNDEPDVPKAFTSDQIRILMLNPGGTILSVAPFLKTLQWGSSNSMRHMQRTNESSNRPAATSVPYLGTKVTAVDVIARTADRSQLVVGVEFEKKGSDPLIMGVEVAREGLPEVSRYFDSQSRELTGSRRNFWLFFVRFEPPPEIKTGDTLLTDVITVRLCRKDSNVWEKAFSLPIVLLWSRPL